MKNLLTITLFIFNIQLCFAQADPVWIVNASRVQRIFDPQTHSSNLSYNYSNIWDLDGDKQKDSLFFIGNGGAHVYFYPRIILSSDGLTRDLPTIQIDMPFFPTTEIVKKWKKNPVVQLVINDLNNDGLPDIYLNFNNPFGAIPKTWKSKGVKTKYVLLSFARGKISVKDYH